MGGGEDYGAGPADDNDDGKFLRPLWASHEYEKSQET